MTTTAEKKILIIAGPNGAGKTTFASAFLPNEAECPIFINADLIAAGISPFRPEAAAFKAGRLMLREIGEHARNGDNFAFETTLSGRHYALQIPQWQESGYRVKLFFLRLASVEIAIQRVRQRISHGGHFVPDTVVRRRFISGWRNFSEIYKSLVDDWAVFDSSGPRPLLLEEGRNR